MSVDHPQFAFPNHFDAGMTLRDWFAGQALLGLCSRELRPASEISSQLNSSVKWADVWHIRPGAEVAKIAYSLADAMMKERDKV